MIETLHKHRQGKLLHNEQGARFFFSHEQMKDDDRTLVESLAFQHGQSPDSYLIVDPDSGAFVSSCQQACAAVIDDGRGMHIPGGILGTAEAHDNFLREVTQYAEENKRRLGFYSILEDALPLFREHNYQITKFGEEPYLKLDGLKWTGKKYEWVRRQTNYCRRHGVQYREINRDDHSDEEWTNIKKQLLTITEDHVAGRSSPRELRLLDGRMMPDHLGKRRLFVAFQEETPDQIIGYVVCNPMYNGKGWGFEIYRKSDDAVRGVIPYLFREIIDLLQYEGAEEVSLCVIPGRGVTKMPGDSPMLRRTMQSLYGPLGILFDSRGQCHFKSRFRPEYRDRYVCIRPKYNFGDGMAFLKTTQAWPFHWGNMLKSMFKK